MKRIELLAPAKNATQGITAINHGADALYIGAAYSARANAGNSIQEIEALCKYAHLYGSKVFVALNTLLKESELNSAELLTHQLYNIGVDALIIQDLSLLSLALPPIPLHASTQCDIRNIEKVQLFEKLNFERVILARELSLHQISEISRATSIELEAFVHGAVCIGYSGQCFISEYACQRSANRGECAQLCRLPYSLQNRNNEEIISEKHFLSLKDMDRSEHLLQMINAGITSFKIEGRLKDETYVKNTTAYYRQKLDAILEQKRDCGKSSRGKTTFFFTPNPQKTFQRSATNFHLTGTSHKELHINTSKSMGEKLGVVTKITDKYFSIDHHNEITNGDGVVFFDKNGELKGFRINSVQQEQLYWLGEQPNIYIGAVVYRNYDHAFEKKIKHKSAERKLAIELYFAETEDGFSLSMKDELKNEGLVALPCNKELAKNSENVEHNICQQLKKLGDSPFVANSVTISINKPYYLPASFLNQLRRECVDRLSEKIIQEQEQHQPHHHPINNESIAIYKRAFSLNPKQLLQSKYCVRGAYNLCLKEGTPYEDLFLVCNQIKWKINCNCSLCEMTLSAY